VVGYQFQKNGWVYNDLPLKQPLKAMTHIRTWALLFFLKQGMISDLRLWKERQLAEENTFVKYGNYSRTSRNTVNADMLNNPILSTMMYSFILPTEMQVEWEKKKS
jgi:hypothetical protein